MFEYPSLSMFSNIEIEEFFQFSQFGYLAMIFALCLAIFTIFAAFNLIFVSSAYTMIKCWIFGKPNISKREDKVWAIFMSFVSFVIIIIVSVTTYRTYPDFYYLHKNYVLTSSYYQKLSDSEKTYVKAELLGDDGEKCLENKICQENFNYNITFKKLDSIISEIKKTAHTRKLLEANQTKNIQQNQEFWQLIQK